MALQHVTILSFVLGLLLNSGNIKATHDRKLLFRSTRHNPLLQSHNIIVNMYLEYLNSYQ